MNERSGSRAPFRGYTSPNYTPVPDELFDEQLPELSGAELKVLLYIIRRTFGFKRESDNISLSQMLNGLRARDGRVLDRGVGLSKKTLLLAIKSLEEQNIILTERRRSAEKGDEPTSYRLNVRTTALQEETTPLVGEKVHHGGGGETPPGPWGRNSATQETGRQETGLDPSNFEGSRPIERTDDDRAGEGAAPSEQDRPIGTTVPLGEVLKLRRQAASAIGQGSRPRGDDPPPPPAAPTIPDQPPARPGPDGVRGSGEERERLAAFLADFARELGDQAPLSATVTRALRVFKTANVPSGLWSDYLYQARAITQEHTGQITKRGGETSGLRRKNKMPYYFGVLEQLVGLRPPPEPRRDGQGRSTPT